MKNLKNPEKRLYFKIIWHVGVLTCIGFGIVMLVQTMNIKEITHHNQRDSIINLYHIKIDEKEYVNKQLVKQKEVLEATVDSLENIKGKIHVDYDQKIKSIYDASAINHAMWLDSTLEKLNSNKK